MSLYNLLFGTNPFSQTLLEILGTHQDAIPRYRDCYLNEDGTEIIIHTRTGGGNRDCYERGGPDQKDYNPDGPFNDDLRAIPGFKADEDEDFDCTYANFHYEVPDAAKPLVTTLATVGAIQNPAERWREVLDGLRKGDTSNPTVQRAIKVGEQIMGQINAADKAGKPGGIIEV